MAKSRKSSGSSKRARTRAGSSTKTTTPRTDPLEMLRQSVAQQQRLGVAQSQDSRGLAEQLLGNIPWQKMLPALLPLILSVLRGKRTASAQGSAGSYGYAPGQSVIPGGGSAAPQLDLIGLLGSLLGGTSGLAQSQSQAQADPLGGLFQALGGAGGTQTRQQSDPLGGLLQLLGGAATAPSQPQNEPLSGLLQALGGGPTAQIVQQRSPVVRRDTAAGGYRGQPGGLLELLGASPEPQRASGVSSLLDLLANNSDLDGDGVPDALEHLLGSQVDTPAARTGATTLVQEVLGNASPQDLASFMQSLQGLLS
jgi:hypothetical protein